MRPELRRRNGLRQSQGRCCVRDKIKSWLKKSNNPMISGLYAWAGEKKRERRKRALARRLASGDSRLITFEDVVAWTRQWMRSFPEAYDMIVGVPRSGLISAGVISLKTVTPLTTPEMFLRGESWKSKVMPETGKIRRVLLVDDCVRSGGEMDRVFDMIRPKDDSYAVTRAALVIHDGVRDKVDLYYKSIPLPRFFEYDLMHHKKVETAGMGLEGVLCAARPPGLDNDEDAYPAWLENATPHMTPCYEIDYIVSNRLEKYRPQTEAWLAGCGVMYGKLLLRDEAVGPAEHKIEVLGRLRPDIFFESDCEQARRIWEAAFVPTICTDEMLFYC